MREFYIINRFPVSFRLLEVHSVLCELVTEPTEPLDVLGSMVTTVLKSDNPELQLELSVKEIYEEAIQSGVEINLLKFREGFIYIRDFVLSEIKQQLPNISFNKLILVSFYEPTKVVIGFCAKDQEAKEWLGILSA